MNSRKVYYHEINDEFLTGENIDAQLLRLTYKLAAPHYSCLRPPGAAGALLCSVYTPFLGRETYTAFLGCAEPPVGPTCKELGTCEMENGHCVRTIHAEVNAILLACTMDIEISDTTLYSLLKPCYQCSKVIAAVGIPRIVYAGAAYNEERTNKLLELAGVTCKHVDIGLEYGNG